MKVIGIDEYGGPEVLRLREIKLPEPGPGEVRVRLHAAGVNFVDIYHRRGVFPAPLPFTLGSEGAGIVDAWEKESKRSSPETVSLIHYSRDRMRKRVSFRLSFWFPCLMNCHSSRALPLRFRG
jgi:NADPH:quinone reductase-like Zn-dependent oxidoreductase